MKDALADCILFSSKLSELSTVNYCYVSVVLSKNPLEFIFCVYYENNINRSYTRSNAKDLFYVIENLYKDELKSILAHKANQYEYGYA
jgi:hypothetical protein